MRRLLNHLFLLGIIVLLGSCSKDDTTDPTPTPEPTPDPQTPVNVELCLEPAAMETRAMDENAIDDINVYFYSEEGSLNYHFYFEEYAPSFTFQMQAGNYELYVVTNVHKDLGEMPEEELVKCEYWGVNMKSDIPMTAQTKVNILSDTTLPTLQVKRAAAKIAYTITVDPSVSSTIQLRSIQFCNVPNSAILFGSQPASTSEEDYYDDAIVDIDDPQTYSAVYYMLENCQGEVESITDPKDKSPENAPKCASYMRILADSPKGASGTLLEYIVYLGENSTSNFDVRKNTSHTLNLVIKGENEIDNRVKVYDGLYYGTANCHICSGNSVSFDVAPYRTSKSSRYIYTGVYAGEEYEAASADLLWEDVKGLISNVSLKFNTVTVVTNGGHGNAVIALYDNNKNIIWSFHIWATEQPGLITIKSTYNAKNRYSMMDRDLGGIEPDGAGLSYQHGRKDPFTSVYKVNSVPDRFKPIYLKNGEEVTLVDKVTATDEDEEFGYCGSIAYSVANPQQYICESYRYPDPHEEYGWVYPGTFDCNADLWGNPLLVYNEYPDNNQIKKSVYDPCPEGYKVSPNDALLSTNRLGGATLCMNGFANPRLASAGMWGSGVGNIFDRLIVFKFSHSVLVGRSATEAGSVRCVKE